MKDRVPSLWIALPLVVGLVACGKDMDSATRNAMDSTVTGKATDPAAAGKAVETAAAPKGADPAMATNTVDISAADKVKPYNVNVKPMVFGDRPALQVSLTDDMQARIKGGLGGDQATFAQVPGPTFQNGEIEVELTSEVNGRGGADARGFVGIAFRIQDDASRFEAVYLRMTNGLKAVPPPPAPRNARAIQYFSYPDWPFARLRKEFPGQYEKAADIAPKEWAQLRLVVDGNTVTAYVNKSLEPTLVVKDLKLGADAKGAIGLWVDDGSDAYFSNLRITRR